MPPDLEIAKPSLQFTATKMDGATVNFPQDYVGKLVMLDFWVTFVEFTEQREMHWPHIYDGKYYW